MIRLLRGGVGMIMALKGTTTLLVCGVLDPGCGGLLIVKVMVPVALPLKFQAAGLTCTPYGSGWCYVSGSLISFNSHDC